MATPMHMIAPVSAGTRNGGSRQEEHPDDAGQRPGQRHHDHRRVDPGLEIHDDQQVNQHNGEQQAAEQLA